METTSACPLFDRHCAPCEGGAPAIGPDALARLLRALPGWSLAGPAIEKTCVFRNHFEAMAFVNAVAWISHREDHHPELTVGFKDVRVRYWTHAVGGLSENDFICAAKVEKLLEVAA